MHAEIIINRHFPGINPLTFGYEDCAPSHSFGPAVRKSWLLHYVISGTGTFTREDQTFSLHAGEIFVIAPYVKHYYEADAETPWRYIWVSFESEISLPSAFSEAVIHCSGVGSIFEDMRRCCSMQSGKTAFLASRIWELIARIDDAGKQGNNYIREAIHCMNAEYMTDLSVAGLAQRLNLDRCYFSSLFKQQVGVSPSQYLMNLRLEKAADLMLQHELTPSVAAASVGYSDIFNFSKMFKKKYGCSPRQYIQENRV